MYFTIIKRVTKKKRLRKFPQIIQACKRWTTNPGYLTPRPLGNKEHLLYLTWIFLRIYPKSGILKMGSFMLLYLKQFGYLSEALKLFNLNISATRSG